MGDVYDGIDDCIDNGIDDCDMRQLIGSGIIAVGLVVASLVRQQVKMMGVCGEA